MVRVWLRVFFGLFRVCFCERVGFQVRKGFIGRVSIWFFECLSKLEMAREVECVRVLKFAGVLRVISRFFCLKGQGLVRFSLRKLLRYLGKWG